MKKHSDWAKINTSREIRMWIGIFMKAVAGSAVAIAWVESHPELKEKFDAWLEKTGIKKSNLDN